MICFPNAKINIGLYITSKREDGFHNLETVFYPVKLHDSLEFKVSEKLEFTNSGYIVDCPADKNLCLKAYQGLAQKYTLPPLHIHLLKTIPFGAGLGGGSADAAFMLTALNEHFNLNASTEELEDIAATIGSDCSFFIKNNPAYATGRGEILEEIDLSLKGKYIVLVKPEVHISTAEAYAGITPQYPATSLKNAIKEDITTWKDTIENDFEKSIFKNHPELATIKQDLYNKGAVYAAMSGSGSTLFGIFDNKPKIGESFSKHFVWEGEL